MARRVQAVTDGLRAELLADAREFGATYADVCRNHPEMVEVFLGWGDSLASGAEVWLHRWQIPDWHPASTAGDPGDHLILGRDDLLREEEENHG